MSEYRDSLPPGQVPLYDEATAKAGTVLAAASADLCHLAWTEGPEAVAALVWRKGHPLTFEQITEFWRETAGLPPQEQAA